METSEEISKFFELFPEYVEQNTRSDYDWKSVHALEEQLELRRAANRSLNKNFKALLDKDDFNITTKYVHLKEAHDITLGEIKMLETKLEKLKISTTDQKQMIELETENAINRMEDLGKSNIQKANEQIERRRLEHKEKVEQLKNELELVQAAADLEQDEIETKLRRELIDLNMKIRRQRKVNFDLQIEIEDLKRRRQMARRQEENYTNLTDPVDLGFFQLEQLDDLFERNPPDVNRTNSTQLHQQCKIIQNQKKQASSPYTSNLYETNISIANTLLNTNRQNDGQVQRSQANASKFQPAQNQHEEDQNNKIEIGSYYGQQFSWKSPLNDKLYSVENKDAASEQVKRIHSKGNAALLKSGNAITIDGVIFNSNENQLDKYPEDNNYEANNFQFKLMSSTSTNIKQDNCQSNQDNKFDASIIGYAQFCSSNTDKDNQFGLIQPHSNKAIQNTFTATKSKQKFSIGYDKTIANNEHNYEDDKAKIISVNQNTLLYGYQSNKEGNLQENNLLQKTTVTNMKIDEQSNPLGNNYCTGFQIMSSVAEFSVKKASLEVLKSAKDCSAVSTNTLHSKQRKGGNKKRKENKLQICPIKIMPHKTPPKRRKLFNSNNLDYLDDLHINTDGSD